MGFAPNAPDGWLIRRGAASLGMVDGVGENRAWTPGRVAAAVIGLAIGLLGVFLLVWGLAMVAGMSSSGAAGIVLLPVGVAFALIGALLILVGGTLAGVPWIARAVRRRRQQRRLNS